MATKKEVEEKYCNKCENKIHCRIPCPLVTATLWDLPCEKELLQMCEEKSRRADNDRKRIHRA